LHSGKIVWNIQEVYTSQKKAADNRETIVSSYN